VKTSRLIGIIVVGVLLLLVFSLVPLDQENIQNQGAQVLGSNTDEITMFRLGDMLGKEKSYICNIFDEDTSSSFQGTLYVEGDTFKTYFETYIKALDRTIDTHALWDGTDIYAWSSFSDIGSRSSATRGDFSSKENAGTNERLYGCVEGDAPPGTFSIPENVIFEAI